MKKLFYILALLMLTGCEMRTNTDNTYMGIGGVTLHPFVYHGHDYVLCKYNEAGGVIHDPDCKKCVTIKRDSI
mgnify:CR=1 FL=1|jgi:hypothetical protein